MAGGWSPKVNRHVQVLKFVSSSVIKVKPGIITGFATDTNPIIRVRHTGEVYGTGAVGVPRRTDVNENQTITKYIAP